MTVCLSDSQLHLFLQTQLPVGHIQDCVQGHTPYTVTDAILTYASSNRGYAQAQEEDPIKENLTVSYESMESPVPHQPILQNDVASDPVQSLLHEEPAESPTNSNTVSIHVHQTNDQLKAVVENCGTKHVSFFLGDGESPGSFKDQTVPSSCLIEASVELHSPSGPELEETLETTIGENTLVHKEQDGRFCHSEEDSDFNEHTQYLCEKTEVVNVATEDNVEIVVESNLEFQKEAYEDASVEIHIVANGHIESLNHSDVTDVILGDQDSTEQSVSMIHEEKETTHNEAQVELCMNESVQQTRSVFEETLESTTEENSVVVHEDSSFSSSDEDSEVDTADLCENSELMVNNVDNVLESQQVDLEDTNEINVINGHFEGLDPTTADLDVMLGEGGSNVPIIHEETMHKEAEVELAQQTDHQPDKTKQESVNINDIVYEDRQSLQSSNESIVKVSDEESVSDDGDVMLAANSDIKVFPEEVTGGHWSKTEAPSIFKLHMNGCPLQKESISDVGSVQEDIETIKGTNDRVSDLRNSENLESTESETAENSDFSILETSCVPELVDSNLTMGEILSLETSEESHEVDVL